MEIPLARNPSLFIFFSRASRFASFRQLFSILLHLPSLLCHLLICFYCFFFLALPHCTHAAFGNSSVCCFAWFLFSCSYSFFTLLKICSFFTRFSFSILAFCIFCSRHCRMCREWSRIWVQFICWWGELTVCMWETEKHVENMEKTRRARAEIELMYGMKTNLLLSPWNEDESSLVSLGWRRIFSRLPCPFQKSSSLRMSFVSVFCMILLQLLFF